jgi:hypothetical protein
MGKKRVVIDDEKVLNSFYDDRETFVVDYDEKLVVVTVEKGSVIFSIKRD